MKKPAGHALFPVAVWSHSVTGEIFYRPVVSSCSFLHQAFPFCSAPQSHEWRLWFTAETQHCLGLGWATVFPSPCLVCMRSGRLLAALLWMWIIPWRLAFQAPAVWLLEHCRLWDGRTQALGLGLRWLLHVWCSLWFHPAAVRFNSSSFFQSYCCVFAWGPVSFGFGAADGIFSPLMSIALGARCDTAFSWWKYKQG